MVVLARAYAVRVSRPSVLVRDLLDQGILWAARAKLKYKLYALCLACLWVLVALSWSYFRRDYTLNELLLIISDRCREENDGMLSRASEITNVKALPKNKIYKVGDLCTEATIRRYGKTHAVLSVVQLLTLLHGRAYSGSRTCDSEGVPYYCGGGG